MDKIVFLKLVDRITSGTATDDEIARYNSWYNAHDANGSWNEDMLGPIEEKKDKLLNGIQSRISVPRKAKLWPRIITVAATIGVIITGIYFYRSSDAVTHDITPGHTGATLTLSGGKKIRLADAANGELAKEAGVVITKTADGKLVYEIKGSSAEKGKINTISTAKGETYQLRLPDGSMVWLNAASSLTYAADLVSEGKRNVKLKGEAYFEISKDKSHPFIVKTDLQEVEVLGTHFNINAYEDEREVKTTLLEGSVLVGKLGKVDPGNPWSTPYAPVILKPGEQSVLIGKKLKVFKVDVNDAVDWKNGEFIFRSQQLADIMRDVKRWYDVEVVFENASIAEKTFTADISRYDNILKLLNILQKTGKVKFRIEGRTVYVSQL